MLCDNYSVQQKHLSLFYVDFIDFLLVIFIFSLRKNQTVRFRSLTTHKSIISRLISTIISKLDISFGLRVNTSATVVPGAPPVNVLGEAVSPTAIQVKWDPPPANRSNGNIIYYKVQFVEADRSDSEASITKVTNTSFVLDELKRWTTYRIWVLAGTSIGDGPPSYPINVQTHEDGTFSFIKRLYRNESI